MFSGQLPGTGNCTAGSKGILLDLMLTKLKELIKKVKEKLPDLQRPGVRRLQHPNGREEGKISAWISGEQTDSFRDLGIIPYGKVLEARGAQREVTDNQGLPPLSSKKGSS